MAFYFVAVSNGSIKVYDLLPNLIYLRSKLFYSFFRSELIIEVIVFPLQVIDCFSLVLYFIFCHAVHVEQETFIL